MNEEGRKKDAARGVPYCCDCERAHLSYVRLSGDAEQKGKRRLQLVSAYPSVIPYTRYTLLRSILAQILCQTRTRNSLILILLFVSSYNPEPTKIVSANH